MSEEHGKTNTLSALIQSMLLPLCSECYRDTAPDTACFPHVVWELASVDLGDLHRDDFFLDVDVWDRGTSAVRADDLMDRIEATFRTKNLPQDTILPTFYVQSRKNLPDADKRLKHRQITIMVQNYERNQGVLTNG